VVLMVTVNEAPAHTMDIRETSKNKKQT